MHVSFQNLIKLKQMWSSLRAYLKSFGTAQRLKHSRKELERKFQIFYTFILNGRLVFVLGMLPSDLLRKEKLYLHGIPVLVAKNMITVCWYYTFTPYCQSVEREL